ncbi:MAG TPA: DUF2142 domain-containing protein [Candidatus Acidoferrum sp.]|jgi:hypothetical protein
MSETAATMPNAASSPERIDAFLGKWEVWIAAGCVCFAVLRILIFAAAFPLFNPVDEKSHYAVIYRFAHGYVPGSELPKTDPEMARVFTLYGSSEYFQPREVLEKFHRDVPIAELPPDLKEYHYAKVFKFWSEMPDMEVQSPPVYYLVGAAWYRIGTVFGLKDWSIAYWMRFLNGIFYGVFVWVAFLFTKEIYPERKFLIAGVPALLAVFPQDVFYGMNRDVLSPMLVAIVLLLLFRYLRTSGGGRAAIIFAGVLTGLAFLTDVPNVVLFVALITALVVKSESTEKSANHGSDKMSMAFSLFGAAILPLFWAARNRLVMGDVTGSRAKTAYLGWTLKSWPEIWHHPIFTLHGLGYFLSSLAHTYWRGEISWAGGTMRGIYADGFYSVSTALLVAAFLAFLIHRGKEENRLQRLNDFLSCYLVAASVLFLAAISLPFDFQNCIYPSREHPYFISGRIICGTMLPFVLIYLSGFEFLWRPIRKYVHPVFPLAIICIGIMVSEVLQTLTVFHSKFNFFALLRG